MIDGDGVAALAGAYVVVQVAVPAPWDVSAHVVKVPGPLLFSVALPVGVRPPAPAFVTVMVHVVECPTAIDRGAQVIDVSVEDSLT